MPDSEEPADQSEAPDLPDEISIDYRRTNQYRVVQVDGAHGGFTPNGTFQTYLYSQNNPLPSESTRKVIDENTLRAEEHHFDSDARFVREVEASLKMSPKAAVQIFQWLAERLLTGVEYGLIDQEKLEEVGKAITEENGK